MDTTKGFARHPARRCALYCVLVASAALAACDAKERPAITESAAVPQQGVPLEADTATAPRTVEDFEDAVPEVPLKEAYFGEIHVHTSYSLDAYIAGTRLTPDMAYRFARGETMTVNGHKHTILRPLDFVAVTDHGRDVFRAGRGG